MTERGGIAAGVVAYVVWGLLTVYWKQLHGLDALELISFRVLASAVLLAVALVVRREWAPLAVALRTRRTTLQLTGAAVLLSVNWTTYVWAVGHDHVVETALGYFLSPLLTMSIGIVVYHERSSAMKRLALWFAAAALVVLVIGYGHVPIVAVLLGTSWACYGVLKRHVPLTPLQSLGGETFVLAPAALAVLVVHAASDGILHGASTGQFVLVGFAGLVTAVPLLLFGAAAQVVPFTILGPLNYFVPTINLLLGVFVYHEHFDGTRLAGFALVWVALVLVTVDGLRPVPRAVAAPAAN